MIFEDRGLLLLCQRCASTNVDDRQKLVKPITSFGRRPQAKTLLQASTIKLGLQGSACKKPATRFGFVVILCITACLTRTKRTAQLVVNAHRWPRAIKTIVALHSSTYEQLTRATPSTPDVEMRAAKLHSVLKRVFL